MTRRLLSPREVEILAALATGKRPKELVVELGCTYQTIKNHLSSAYRKLDATGLVEAFVRIGWLRPTPEPMTTTQAVRRLVVLRGDLAELGDEVDRVIEQVRGDEAS